MVILLITSIWLCIIVNDNYSIIVILLLWYCWPKNREKYNAFILSRDLYFSCNLFLSACIYLHGGIDWRWITSYYWADLHYLTNLASFWKRKPNLLWAVIPYPIFLDNLLSLIYFVIKLCLARAQNCPFVFLHRLITICGLYWEIKWTMLIWVTALLGHF